MSAAPSPAESSAPSPNPKTWDPGLYDSKHSFVWRYGAELIELLAPQPGERILDVGCGTGHLTARLAESDAFVTGLDRSLAMLAEARKNYPGLTLVAEDATRMAFARPFDAVFSNAALHWILDAERVVERIAACLRPGGRFVAEFGGKGNLAQIRLATHEALDAIRRPEGKEWIPKFYPTIGEYDSLLERHGLAVRSARLFDRPTPLDGGDNGLRTWLEMFEEVTLGRLAPADRRTFIEQVEARLQPQLFRAGRWIADYVRLRLVAVRN